MANFGNGKVHLDNVIADVQYINMKWIKGLMGILSVLSFLFLCFYSYDSKFKSVMILPIVYILSTLFFIRNDYGKGLGRTTLVLVYAFRMCVLPVICAYGNFWLEPSKKVYIDYFPWAIMLMAFENFFVFFFIFYYSRKYDFYACESENLIQEQYESVLVVCLIVVFIMVCVLFIVNGDLKNYYSLILGTDSADVETLASGLQNYGAIYYLLVLLDILFRPIFSFYIISKLLEKKTKWSTFLAIGVAFINVIVMTDRRILSVLIGLVCLMEIMYYNKSKFVKKMLYCLMAIGMIGVIFFCFSSDMLVPYLVARKFQRYFSGPTLTAIGINILVNHTPSIVDFLKLLFNDSILLTGLFGSYETREYVLEVCGPSGTSIWTPMIIGIFQYFKIFGPIILALIVKYVVKNDYISSNSKGMKKLIIDYLSVSVAIYMVMYSVELVIYNIIFIGGFFRLILYINDRFWIKVGERYIS